MATKQISGKQILDLLQKGYVRYKKDITSDSPGSIEETLEISASNLREFLRHPKLANFRYKAPKIEFVDDFGPELIDDFDDNTPVSNDTKDIDNVLNNIVNEAEVTEQALS